MKTRFGESLQLDRPGADELVWYNGRHWMGGDRGGVMGSTAGGMRGIGFRHWRDMSRIEDGSSVVCCQMDFLSRPRWAEDVVSLESVRRTSGKLRRYGPWQRAGQA